FLCTDNILEAAAGSDVLYTDVWASMGQEDESEMRKKIFKDYQINDSVVEVSNEGVMVLHCLPAHRGEEITAKVLEEHADEIFDEAENRLHAQKAVLVKCMAD
ncbi:MAG: ornithine carbamoyltransferase, partial [Clostridia bacterium]|nr:ornithine carbamoyltransferase [Clostridia bacterium]